MINEKLNEQLVKAIIAGIAVFVLSVAGFVWAYSRSSQPSSYRTFNVRGEGRAVIVPDIAKFNFKVISEGKNLSALQKTNSEKSNAVIEFLKSAGIEKKDIKTVSYSVEPKYRYAPCIGSSICPPPSIDGYVISSSVEVTIRKFENISDILSGAVDKGANSVSQLDFTVEDRTEVENTARAEAIKNAREKARELAKAGGFRIGKIIAVSESTPVPPTPFYSYGRDEIGIGGGGPIIEPGTNETIVTVILTYEIR